MNTSTTPPVNIVAINMRRHLEANKYKRGAYQGDAPLDAGRRSRSHTRVAVRSRAMAVVMYRTDILTAHDDGRIVLDCGGWGSSSTTKMRLTEAFKFLPFRIGVGTDTIMGINQLVLRVEGKKYLYYDGITLMDGQVVSEHKPFEMRRINRTATKALADDVKASGFREMFPLLYATATPDDAAVPNTALIARNLLDYITDTECAHRWPEVITTFKFTPMYDYKTRRSTPVELGDVEFCWAAIMNRCKADMYETLRSDITSI